jgi:hypothetical protein
MIPIDSAPFVHEILAPILHEIKSSDYQSSELTEKLVKNYNEILDSIANLESTVDLVRESIDQTITHHEASLYTESEVLYTHMMEHDSVDYILDRRFALTDVAQDFIKARIQLQGNWKHAGMVIRPGREDWIDLLVGCDPLYLVDNNLGLLEPAVLRFNDQYQRRLRTYEVKELNDPFLLRDLPDQQFAYVLAYNFFNFKTENVIKTYLNELYQKLKPGGQVGFTFNDGDRSGAGALAERHYSFYTPGKTIYKHIVDLGFTIHQKYANDPACTWVEIHKPGELTSMRGGQALAEIIPNPEPEITPDPETNC